MKKEMEEKQACNLQSRFLSAVMTLVGDDVMGKDLEPISGAGGLETVPHQQECFKYLRSSMIVEFLEGVKGMS
jgi:hypothetical protein